MFPCARAAMVRGRTRSFAVSGVVALLLVLTVLPAAAYPVDPTWAPPRTVYIPATGQTIDRLFLDLWRSGGGVWSYGNPITPEITQSDGRIIQYFEYARFEYWPEGDADGNHIVLGRIGAELRPFVMRRNGPTAASTLSYAGRSGRAVARQTAPEARAWLAQSPASVAAKVSGEPSYRFVPETGHGVWGGFRAFWEASGEAAYLGNPLTEEYVSGGTSYQVFERGQLRWQPGEVVAMVAVGSLLADRYGLATLPVAQGDVPTYDEALFIPPIVRPALAAAPAAPAPGRAVVVSLSQQALWAYEDGAPIRASYISTGKPGFETPLGLYYVNSKIDAQTMEGVLGGEYYNVPNVPYVMYFTDRGHALHGTYWHDNFGMPMSHGCVNLPVDVAEWMYGWAPMGMAVLIVP